MNFDVLHAQKKGAIELTNAELQSVYGGQGGSDTNVPIAIPVVGNDIEVLDLLGHVLGPISGTGTAANPAGSTHSRQSSSSSDED